MLRFSNRWVIRKIAVLSGRINGAVQSIPLKWDMQEEEKGKPLYICHFTIVIFH